LTNDAGHIGLPVLRLLADGQRHSGTALAAALGMSRAAVWKQVKRLEALGLDIDVRRGAGYRIQPPLDVLDAGEIRGALTPATQARLESLDVLTQVRSTNAWLLERDRAPVGRLAACLAEYQSGGRGRRGRAWLTPPGRGLCLSTAWTYATQPKGIESLGLAVGAVARDVLNAHTGLDIGVKWPNDLIVADRKLGGILIELVAEGHGNCFVVIGIGLNVTAVPALVDSGSANDALRPIDLGTALADEPPSRNTLAASLIDALAAMLDEYPTTGFAAYRRVFDDADYLYGRPVTVESPNGPIDGRAVGIGDDGRLRVDCRGVIHEVVAGDVSVRPRL
jgi:BirA family biotin operon repressor/biotin-[acetyl-CoA-carboxylase] ligase